MKHGSSYRYSRLERAALVSLLWLAASGLLFAGGSQETSEAGAAPPDTTTQNRGVEPQTADDQAGSAEEQPELPLDADTAALLGDMGVLPFANRVPSEDFALPTLTDDEQSLSDSLGNVVFLNFWGTWCPPCREEMPSMQVLYDELADEGFEMLAVNVLESREVAGAFIDEFGFTYPVLLDRDGRVGLRYGVRGYPTTYIIDRDGYVIGVKAGYHDWGTPQVIDSMRALLEMEPTASES